MTKLYRGLALAAAALALAGCQGVGETSQARVDAPGVPVALDTLEGAPEGLRGKVSDEIITQASARRIELVASGAKPRYRLKGYLTAYSTDTGDTALAVVWDVFDSTKQRAQRVTTTTIASGQASDPWSRIGETQISKTTSQSMNQVAAFLAGSPIAPESPAPRAASTAALGFDAAE
jgi:hypothetical protein